MYQVFEISVLSCTVQVFNFYPEIFFFSRKPSNFYAKIFFFSAKTLRFYAKISLFTP